MHGEYKVPGGKLVVVDLKVQDGLIRDFRLAGDFFLEPDTALEAINAGAEGMPVPPLPRPSVRRRWARSCWASPRNPSALLCAARW